MKRKDKKKKRFWQLLLLLFWFPLYGYEVKISPVADSELAELLCSASELVQAKNHPPPTFFTLKKRAEKDKEKWLEIIHTQGFFDAEIHIEYEGEFPKTLVHVCIDWKEIYRFGQIAIAYDDLTSIPICFPQIQKLLDIPFSYNKVLDMQLEILEELQCAGYPFPELLETKLLIDAQTKKVHLTLLVDPGEISFFGRTIVKGICHLKPAFFLKRLSYRPSQRYHPKLITCTEAALIESGLFSFVKVYPDENSGCDLLMKIEVQETKQRHVGLGVSYSTDESAGALAQWSHDNLSGMADSFSFLCEYSEVVKRATMAYNRPDVYIRHQDLTFSLEFRREDTPGFIEREMSLLSRLSRKFADWLYGSIGLRYERLLSTKSDNNEDYHLVSVPMLLQIDFSNNLLNKTRGFSFQCWVSPYQTLFDSPFFFSRQELFTTAYYAISSRPQIILAASAQLGSIVGQSRITIPSPKRFYSGSSTGLRGYKYLTVSPLLGTKPIGGRSLMIFQIEPRILIWDKLYFVTFFDIGNVYSPSFPNFSVPFLRSTGLGLRYLTPIGAFRIDVGFPLDPRKEIDKTFQIYASIGQTF